MDAQAVTLLPPLAESTLCDWVARSAWLGERLTCTPDAGGVGGDKEAAAFASWRRLAAKDHAHHFDTYLERLGLSERQAVLRLGPARQAGHAALPDWAARLPAWIALVCAGDAATDGRDDGNVPFGDLFRPLGSAVWDRIARHLDGSLWAAPVRDDVSAGLTTHLSALFADSLYVWFDAFRSVRQSHGQPAADASNRIYADFLAWLRSGHFVRLLDRKPVLARFFAISILQWEQHVTELAQRLERDRQAIVTRLFAGRAPGAVAGLDFGMSDRHRDGRGVAIVRFDGGQQLVYKPRDLGIDGAWATFLQRIQAAGAPGELRTPDVLCRDGYGWTSFVDAKPCASLDEVRTFYARAGALLALFQILGSCDFHQENVIACGSHPIPVDLETLLRPAGRLDGDDRSVHPAISAAARRVSASVFESGYLPYWNTFRSTRWIGGGLSWSAPEEVTVTGWLHANTDAMTLGRKPLVIAAVRHLPRLAESVVDPSGHLGDIDAGLVAMGRFVLAHRETVRDALAVFRDTSVRVVLRDTRFYEMLSRRAAQPTRLADGLSASLEFEFLMRFHHPLDANTMTWVRREQAAMLRLDTPLFRMRSDGTTLHEAGSEEVEFSYPESDVLSPIAHAAARLDAFDDAHLEQQRRLMRFAFSRDGVATAFADDAWPQDGDRAWRPDEMVQRATRIGEHLQSLAVVGGGGAAWIGLPTTAIDAEPRIQVLGENFYDGTTGIAVFLLALARATGRDDFRQVGLDAFATLRDRFVRERHAGFSDRDRILGGAEGLASCIYPLVLGAQLAESDVLLDWAEEIAQCIGDAWIGADTAYDVIGGAAGAMLGLLALHEAGRPIGLDRAIACGAHLLAHCRPAQASGAPGHARALAGMSHGAAGFAYALERLAAASARRECSSAAAEWVAYEHALFDEATGNWPDLRFAADERPQPDHAICRWCHGASGIGLARLGMVRHGASARAVLEDVERAIARTVAEPMSALDCLCCGNFGRLDLLLEAGVTLGRPALVALARRRAAARLDRTVEGFSWPFGSDNENLGFFQGLAGIGYELLRLAYPNEFPCALLWGIGPRPIASAHRDREEETSDA
ncbi:type 2 lanthipeptide synthetase LanM family protein [Burkholderia stabilis]|uniref:type 2 lanthipeptide synthetase LanM family protein n=1 Tax=Burkholderia stabilis TaxID=95485 RepID=UPI000AA38D46|nr:type 2 lanthipeptide synthetase LanM family protein [Burkholderia stabilis]